MVPGKTKPHLLNKLQIDLSKIKVIIAKHFYFSFVWFDHLLSVRAEALNTRTELFSGKANLKLDFKMALSEVWQDKIYILERVITFLKSIQTVIWSRGFILQKSTMFSNTWNEHCFSYKVNYFIGLMIVIYNYIATSVSAFLWKSLWIHYIF